MARDIATLDLVLMKEGAIVAQVNEAIRKVIKNMADPNTDAKAKRTVNLKLTFSSDEERTAVGMKYQVQSKTVGDKAGLAMVAIGVDKDGNVHASEVAPQGRTMEINFDEIGDDDEEHVDEDGVVTPISRRG